jgi:hypothetical protein
MAEREREAAGRNAFAFVGGAAAFNAQLAVRARHGRKFASNRGSHPKAQEGKTGGKKDFDMCVHGVTRNWTAERTGRLMSLSDNAPHRQIREPSTTSGVKRIAVAWPKSSA